MWPVLLDMTKEESMQSLRNLELEAYSQLVSALRAQGPLNPDKKKLLKDTGLALNIPPDRHKAEIRRAINDEKLNTIAYHVTGLPESLDDWAQEGRRTVPLIPRMAPQTAYSALADEVADNAALNNKHLPHPAATERKRLPQLPPQILMGESSKGPPFRIPETPKTEEGKKRKLSISTENSSLAQHLLNPPKMSRTQQMYRQRTKNLINRELGTKLKGPHVKSLVNNGPKPSTSGEETIEQIQNEINSYKPTESENRPKGAPMKPALTFKQAGPSGIEPKNLKICTKKTVGKPGASLGGHQKVIVVSNAQTLQSSSILQKTLSLPLVKNISVKNFEKFKIVTTTSPQLVSAAHSVNKHKMVTVKTNSSNKKVFPLSLLNSKGGIKVLPIGGKIVGKTITSSSMTSPLYIVNTLGASKMVPSVLPIATEAPPSPPNKENGKSSVLGDIMKASGVTMDDFDTQIEEFRIPNNHVSDSVEPERGAEEEARVEELPKENVTPEENRESALEKVEEVVDFSGVEIGGEETIQDLDISEGLCESSS